jgi:predicted O-methyltransferase YrrM
MNSYSWEIIPGYFISKNAYKMCFDLVSENGTIVEIGAWKGRSTCCMGQIIKSSNKKVDFYTIDTWQGSNEEDHQEQIKELNQQGLTLYGEFKKHLSLCGVDDVVKPIKSTSIEASKTFEDATIDLLIIDGSHEYNDVLDDITFWYSKIKPGGIILGDDWFFEDVRKAVYNYFQTKEIVLLPNDRNGPKHSWFYVKNRGKYENNSNWIK